MADIRINSLPTTASASSSDDFLALDGATNGTRKLNAFSPTFGGNLTASGTGTFGGVLNAGGSTVSPTGATTSINLNTTTANWEVGRNNTAGGFYIYGYGGAGYALKLADATGNATLGSNLTVSGAVRAGAIPTVGTEIGDFYQATAGSNAFRAVHVNGNAIRLNPSYNYYDSYDHIFRSLSGTTTYATIKNNGNFLIGTTTDSSNGKLQLATHTTSAGGIGFGTDTSLYRVAAGLLGLNGTGSSQTFGIYVAGTQRGTLGCDATSTYLANQTAGGSLVLLSGAGTTALTLDSSQNATFAQNITANGTDLSSVGGAFAIKAANAAHRTSMGVLQYNANVTALRSYGATAGTGSIQFLTGGGGNSADTLALTLDSSQNATFAGAVKAPSYQLSTDAQGTIISSNSNVLNIDAAAGDIRVRPKAGSDFVIGNSAAIKLGNAYTAGAPTATGYVTIKDSAGNTYKVLVGT